MARPPDLAISPESMSGENRPIPEPSPAGEGMVLVAPDARTQAVLLIRRARGNRSLAELARALQTSWPSAQRLENPRHSPTLRPLEKAAAALGKGRVLVLERSPEFSRGGCHARDLSHRSLRRYPDVRRHRRATAETDGPQRDRAERPRG